MDVVMTSLTTRIDSGREQGRIAMRGRLDRDADSALTAAYADATAGGATELELDFGEVGYINSTGIALVVRLLAEARRDGRTVVATGLSKHYREIFRITRLSDFMTIVGDEPGED
jgi:anti-anti-sigma factor